MNTARHEIVRLVLDYNPHELLEYYYTLDHKDINDVKITHKKEWVERNKTTFDGDKIRDLKNFSKQHQKNVKVDIRKDLVSECNKEHPIIKKFFFNK